MLGGTTTTTKASDLVFYILWGSTQLMGLHAVLFIALLYNSKLFDGGYDWEKTPFSFHPTMMTVGMLFCYGNAILLYRTFTQTPKLTVKVLHAILLVASFVFAIVGLTAIIRNKNVINKPPGIHFMSFHAWIGLITFILFAFQWVCGFISFLFPTLSLSMRQRYMPSHRLWGKTIFLLAVAAIISGLSEYGTNSAFFVKDDAQRQRRLILIFFGLFTTAFCFLVIYLLSNPEYQRPPDNNDQPAITLTNEHALQPRQASDSNI